jgi:molybdenum cofactor biosynthesis enzyme MoaA
VSFLGGEPLLQKEVQRVCDRLIELGLEPGVFVTTNGTVFNAWVERMLSQLPVNLAISLDAASPRTFERVRAGARWDVVRRNLDRFVERIAKARGSVRLNFCVMRATWMELPGFLSLAAALPAEVWVTVVTDPEQQSLLSLPPAALRVVHQRLVAAEQANWPQKSREIYASVVRTLAASAARQSVVPEDPKGSWPAAS